MNIKIKSNTCKLLETLFKNTPYNNSASSSTLIFTGHSLNHCLITYQEAPELDEKEIPVPIQWLDFAIYSMILTFLYHL